MPGLNSISNMVFHNSSNVTFHANLNKGGSDVKRNIFKCIPCDNSNNLVCY